MYENNTPEDAPFRVLSHPTRRAFLHVLRENEPITIETATIALSGNEALESAKEKPEHVKTALQHIHLPKLDDEGIIDYEPNTGLIRRAEKTDTVYRYLDAVSTTQQ